MEIEIGSVCYNTWYVKSYFNKMLQFLIFGSIIAFSGLMYHNTKCLTENFNDTAVITPISNESGFSLYETGMPSASQQQEYAKFYDAVLSLLDDAHKNTWNDTLKLNSKTLDTLATKSSKLTANEVKANFKPLADALSLVLNKPVVISDVKSNNEVLTIRIDSIGEYNINIPYLVRVAHALS